MAESVLTWVLFLHRKIPTYATQQRQKIWLQQPHSLSNKCCVGILGLGELGKASALQLTSNKVTLLPHVSATTNPATAVKIIAANIREFRNQGTLGSFVNLARGY